MTIIINEETTRELLQKAVEVRGADYVYDDKNTGQCDYVRDGEPSCIVGTVFALAGVPIDTLYTMDDSDQVARRHWTLSNGFMHGYEGNTIGGTSLDLIASAGLLEAYEIEVTPLALQALVKAQSRQDRGAPWGVAADSAIEIIEKGASK